jgi:hypothetical protein
LYAGVSQNSAGLIEDSEGLLKDSAGLLPKVQIRTVYSALNEVTVKSTVSINPPTINSHGCICGPSKFGGASSVVYIRDEFVFPQHFEANDPRIQVYVMDSRDMMMNFHQPVTSSPAIGLQRSEIQFEPKAPGEGTNIEISFTLSMRSPGAAVVYFATISQWPYRGAPTFP